MEKKYIFLCFLILINVFLSYTVYVDKFLLVNLDIKKNKTKKYLSWLDTVCNVHNTSNGIDPVKFFFKK